VSARFAASFEIAGRRVGTGEPCYVIAEAGANHNRDLDVALELIDVAARAGADAVKFQTYTGAGLYSSKTPRFEYLGDDRPIQEILEEVALPREWQPRLAEHARERGIAFFSSPFDHDAVDGLRELGVPAMKIASFEIVDLDLIRHAAGAGVPVILSTGMATHEEIGEALAAAADGGATEVALLRTASLYPAPPEIVNLRGMRTLRERYGVPVGLSDHSEGIAVATGGAALGMELVEKHFTLDRRMPGPDHPFAIEPDELTALVAGIRAVERALGDGEITGPSELEAGEMYRNARRSVIAAVDIPAGTEIARGMLTVKRPGYGVKPRDIDELVGRTAKVDIEFDDVIEWEMVEPG
jgi:sialic acid synthase SpsE